MASVLVIDDDPKFCDVLSQLIREMGHHPRWVHTLREGLKEAAQGENDVVFLDVRLPDGNGLEALPRIHQMPGTPEVIIMTGEGDPDGAELAIKSGAWDYLGKPSSLEAMALPFLRALQYREEKKARSPRVALRLEGIAGQSRKMKASFDLVAQAASSDASVLITGETGTGKELFAWAIHQNSRRSGKSFVVVDCAALPETLVESILFGHEKGAFTGADRVREGLIQQADGGTLFLDEVGELPLTVQGAFLRVLQDHCFRPLGGRREVGSDFRVVAATNQNLNTMVDQGLFRKDLLFRLRSLTIELPPLRERKEDLAQIAIHHIAKFCEKAGQGIKGFSPDFLETLLAYDWPGNVREFISVLERSLAAAKDDAILYAKHLPNYIRINMARSSLKPKKEFGEESPTQAAPPLKKESLGSIHQARGKALHGAEKEYLLELMAVTKGDMAEACRVSGLARARLYQLLNEHKIPRPR